MNIRIEKYNGQSFEELEDIFRSSSIYTVYFQKNGVQTSLRKAAEAGELYIASDESGAAVGAMWICLRGFCGLYPYLKLIGVREKYRSFGVGAQMAEEYERIGRQSGARKLSLLVSGFNDGAQKFYLSHGYYKAGKIENASLDGVSEILMLKDLK